MPTRALVGAGLLFVVALALTPVAAGVAVPRHDTLESTGDLLGRPADVTPAVVAEVVRIEWRPGHRSTRIPLPIVLLSMLGGAALIATARAHLQLGPDGQARAMRARPWRGRAPPARFSPTR